MIPSVFQIGPADARGVLSYIHGEPGIYGYLHNVKVDPSLFLNGKTGTLRVRYEVKADAEAKGGFALYGARMGRYPTGPHLAYSSEIVIGYQFSVFG